MTKAAHAREDLIGRLRPHERLGVPIRESDVMTDRLFEFTGAAMDTPAQLFVSQGREPALHEIDPRRTGRREVQVHAGMPYEPAADQRRLMRARVVENEMKIQLRRHGGVDGVEKFPKLGGALALVKLAEDLAALGVQGREERGGAVARVVVRPSLDLPRP